MFHGSKRFAFIVSQMSDFSVTRVHFMCIDIAEMKNLKNFTFHILEHLYLFLFYDAYLMFICIYILNIVHLNIFILLIIRLGDS